MDALTDDSRTRIDGGETALTSCLGLRAAFSTDAKGGKGASTGFAQID